MEAEQGRPVCTCHIARQTCSDSASCDPPCMPRALPANRARQPLTPPLFRCPQMSLGAPLCTLVRANPGRSWGWTASSLICGSWGWVSSLCTPCLSPPTRPHFQAPKLLHDEATPAPFPPLSVPGPSDAPGSFLPRSPSIRCHVFLLSCDSSCQELHELVLDGGTGLVRPVCSRRPGQLLAYCWHSVMFVE